MDDRPAPASALLTWTCEGCGAKRKVGTMIAAHPMPEPVIPLPGWGLIRDPAQGALAFCGTCLPRVRRRLAATA